MLTKIFGEPLLHGHSEVLNKICLGWHILCTVYLPVHFITMIVMGSKYIDDCPFDNWIPRLTIIVGIYGVIEEIFRRFIVPLSIWCLLAYYIMCAVGSSALLWDTGRTRTDVTDPDFLKHCSFFLFEFYCISMAILDFCVLITCVLLICQYKYGMCERSTYTPIPEDNTTATP